MLTGADADRLLQRALNLEERQRIYKRGKARHRSNAIGTLLSQNDFDVNFLPPSEYNLRG